MNLIYRIALGFLALLAVMVALAVYHLLALHRVGTELAKVSATTFETLQLSSEIRENVSTLIDLTSKLPLYRRANRTLHDAEEMLSGNGSTHSGATEPEQPSARTEERASRLEELRQEVDHRLLRFDALQGLSLGELEAIENFRKGWKDYRTQATTMEAHILAGEEESAFLERRLRTIRSRVSVIQRASQTALGKFASGNQAEAERAELVAQGAALLALVAGLVTSLIVGTSVVRPLKRLARGTRELAKGDFSYRVPPSGGPELVALAEDFNIMAERLSVLDQLKKDLVSNVSHDLKAPLASMQETTRLLLDRLPGPLTEKQARFLEINLRCGERLSSMISDLLDLSRLEAQGQPWPLETQDLRALVATSLDELESFVQDKGLRVLRELPDEPVSVECHGPSMLQVLQNLVSNAVKFSPPGSEIGVRLQNLAAAKGTWWRRPSLPLRDHLNREVDLGILVEVWDSGPGIPDDHKERVFDRFHRVDGERRGQQGTGLGLAIAQAIVQRHRGALWVEDRAEAGSSFRMVLWRQPRAEESDARARQGAIATSSMVAS